MHGWIFVVFIKKHGGCISVPPRQKKAGMGDFFISGEEDGGMKYMLLFAGGDPDRTVLSPGIERESGPDVPEA